MGFEIEIMSKENIKPAFPTPQHLRTYKVSILDQLHHHVYVPIVYFYLNNNQGSALNDGTIQETRRCLKQSLSHILARFYPFAGKVIDNNSIDCNDDGVYYVEARVSYCLSDFLIQPDYKLVHRLLPFHPSTVDSLAKTYVVMVQVNIFDCGGIAIGVYTSHKIIDGQSHMAFMNSWAAAARGSSEKVLPSFVSPSLFLPDFILPKNATFKMFPSINEESKCVSKRFVFNAKALTALKDKAVAADTLLAKQPSRFMAATALIWKSAMATCEVRSGCKRSSVLSFAVNLRTRNSPPLPSSSVGNIVWSAVAQCTAPQATDLELHSVVGHLKNAIAGLDSDFVEGIKGEDGPRKVKEYLNEFKKFYSKDGAEPDYFGVTSWCNGGAYETDFGWGKPTWACVGNANADIPALRNLVFLMDTRSGDGIEAWVTLSDKDMAVFEQDPDIIAFASFGSKSFGSSNLCLRKISHEGTNCSMYPLYS